jgi:hypothetical protein
MDWVGLGQCLILGGCICCMGLVGLGWVAIFLGWVGVDESDPRLYLGRRPSWGKVREGVVPSARGSGSIIPEKCSILQMHLGEC